MRTEFDVRAIVGQVSAAGVRRAGSGYTVKKQAGSGSYTLYLDPGVDAYAVFITPLLNNYGASAVFTTSRQISISLFNTTTAALADNDFCFMVMIR